MEDQVRRTKKTGKGRDEVEDEEKQMHGKRMGLGKAVRYNEANPVDLERGEISV